MEGYGLKEGGAFDLMTFLKQPITIMRLLCWVFSVVVLGSVANEGWVNRPDWPEMMCVFNGSRGACHLAEGAGSVALLCSSAFLLLDLRLLLRLPQTCSVKDKRRFVTADIIISGGWSLLWFTSFCVLAHQWQISTLENPLGDGADAARAAILFSFFSIFSWGGLTLLSVERMRRVSFEEEYNKLFTPHT